MYLVYPNKKPWLDSQKNTHTHTTQNLFIRIFYNNNAFCWLIPCNQNQTVPENCNAWLET